jgi:hypothetical protein
VALGETAVLVAELQLVDKFSGTAKKALAGLNKIDTAAARTGKGFYTLGAGIGTAIRRGTVLAIGALATLSALVAKSVREGQEVQKVNLLFANAVKSSGQVTSDQTAKLVKQQDALLRLTGQDDELITTIQTRLIQMRATGKQTLALTPLIVAASRATGKDVGTITLAVGKALQGSQTSLTRLGIIMPKITAEQKKAITGNKKLSDGQKAAALAALSYEMALAELQKRFGKVNAAMAGTLETRLAVLKERLASIREDFGLKLLPVLTRIADVVAGPVVDAFAKFIDRITPDVIGGLNEFAKALENGAAEEAISGISDALGTMIDLLKIAAAPVKAIVGAFMSLPKGLQTALVAGFAVNKLSGGMIGQGIGQIIGGAFNRGGSPANPMFVADVTGGLGGGIGGKGGKGLLGTLLSLPVLIGGAVIAGSLAAVQTNVIQPGLEAQANANNDATTKLIQSGTINDLRQAVKGLEGIPANLHKGDRTDIVGAIQAALYEFNANGVKTHNEALIAALKAAIAQREAETASTPTPGVDRQGAGISVQRPRGEHAGRISNPTRAGIILRVIEKTGKAPTADRVTAILLKTNASKLQAIKDTVRSGDDVMAQKLAALDSATRGVTSAVNGTTAAVNRWSGFTIPAPVVSITVNPSTGFTTRTLTRTTRVARSINPAPIPGKTTQPT